MGRLSPLAARPKSVTVKPPKPRLRPKPHCVVCRAAIRDDHCVGELVCDCHPRDGGDPGCAAPLTMTLTAEERLLVMLYRAAPAPLNVHRAFGCPSTTSNMTWFRDAVRRINARTGLICGHHHVGYKFVGKGNGGRSG